MAVEVHYNYKYLNTIQYSVPSNPLEIGPELYEGPPFWTTPLIRRSARE